MATFFYINVKSKGYGDVSRVYSATKVAPFGYGINLYVLE